MPNHPTTPLASGSINGADVITVELIKADTNPAVIRIVWPTAPTITTPATYNEVAAAAMRVLAQASTTLAGLKRVRRRL